MISHAKFNVSARENHPTPHLAFLAWGDFHALAFRLLYYP